MLLLTPLISALHLVNDVIAQITQLAGKTMFVSIILLFSIISVTLAQHVTATVHCRSTFISTRTTSMTHTPLPRPPVSKRSAFLVDAQEDIML